MSDRYVKIGTIDAKAGGFYGFLPAPSTVDDGPYDVFVKLPPVPPRPTVWLNNARTLGVTFEHRRFVVPSMEPNGEPTHRKSVQEVLVDTMALSIPDVVVEELLKLPNRTVRWETAQGARAGVKDA